jgi:hypothetical protein
VAGRGVGTGPSARLAAARHGRAGAPPWRGVSLRSTGIRPTHSACRRERAMISLPARMISSTKMSKISAAS